MKLFQAALVRWLVALRLILLNKELDKREGGRDVFGAIKVDGLQVKLPPCLAK